MPSDSPTLKTESSLDSTSSIHSMVVEHTEHSFYGDAEEKRILERSRVMEMVSLERPKLLGCIDTFSFLIAFAVVNLIGNVVSIYDTWEEPYTPLFYFFYVLMTVIGIQGLLEKKAAMICAYAAYILASTLIDTSMSGALLYTAVQPDFCGRIQSLSSLSPLAYNFCERHITLVRLGTAGTVLASAGMSILVICQLWKAFQWAEVLEDAKSEESTGYGSVMLEV